MKRGGVEQNAMTALLFNNSYSFVILWRIYVDFLVNYGQKYVPNFAHVPGETKDFLKYKGQMYIFDTS